MEQYQKYIQDVLSGKAIVGKHVRNAVLRQVNDLKRQKTPEFPYYFDEDEANRWISFIKCLKFTRGKWMGKNFNPQPIQAFRWACVFGWKSAETDKRRFRKAYIEVAKKNGKTEEAAAIAAGLLLIDNENTPQILCAANSSDQAGEVFEACKSMIRMLSNDSETIASIVDILTHNIKNKENNGYIRKVSTDLSNTEGKHAHGAVVDEVHLFPTSDLIDSITSGMAAREQPLLYQITTAGFNIGGVCWDIRENAINVISGIKTDETLFGTISTLDDDDDWKDKTTWIKSAPNIGESPRWDFMESEFNDAINQGGQKEVSFKTKNLNMWVGSSKVWIQDELWQKCGGEIDLESLRGRPCYVGIDFASVCDFTALVLLFPGRETDGEDKEPHILVPYFWIPETVLEMRGRDLPDLYKWSHRVTDNGRSMPGKVNVTPTNFTDYEYIIKEVAAINEMFDIKVLGYDPANAYQTIIRLDEAGINTDKFSQGIMNMSAPSKEFERLVRMEMFNHGNNPVLRWMLSCCMPYYDSNENLKVQKLKESRTAKIDGIVASIIAVGEMCKNPIPDVYSKVDLFLI